MKRERVGVVRWAAMVALGWAFLAGAAPRVRAATWDVAIQNFAFVPANLTINVGDTVRWTQKDAAIHTTTSGANGVADGLWNSGNMSLSANRVFSFTFNTPGTYPYYCVPHPATMRATIVVKAVQGPTVSLTEPADAAVFLAPATIALTAQVSPGGNPVAKVLFYSNAVQVAEVTAPPYTTTLSQLAPGPYSFTAEAVDTGGLKAASTSVSVTVEAPTPATLTGVERVGALGVRLAWTGGNAPFLLQRKSALGDAAWTDVASTEHHEIVVARETDAAFYRVASHTDRTVTPFTTWLSGGAERPNPVDTAGTGFGSLILAGNTLTVDVAFSGLSGAATAAHIHGIAPTSTSAGVLVGLQVPPSAAGRITGTYDVSALTEEQRHALVHGHTYINIHTAKNPTGEVRGQVAPVLWEAVLSGSAERPNPVNTPGTGHGNFWLVGNELTYSVSYSGLSSTAVASHLHGPADYEAAAGVLQHLEAEGPLGVAGTFQGMLTLTLSQLAAVVDELTYVNVHTATNPGGEVRGQVAGSHHE